MTITIYTIIVITFLVLAYAGTCFQRSYLLEKLFTWNEFHSAEIIYLVISAVSYITSGIALFYFGMSKEISIVHLAEDALLWDGCFICAWTDFRKKKIPNQMILILTGIKAIGVLLQILAEHEEWQTAVLPSLAGMILTGAVLVICRLISRGGLGAGDIKLFSVIGLYLGIVGVLNVGFYAILFAAGYSIVMLLAKKADGKSKIALAPFIWIGCSIYLYFLIIAG